MTLSDAVPQLFLMGVAIIYDVTSFMHHGYEHAHDHDHPALEAGHPRH